MTNTTKESWEDRIIALVEEEITLAAGTRKNLHVSGRCKMNEILDCVRTEIATARREWEDETVADWNVRVAEKIIKDRRERDEEIRGMRKPRQSLRDNADGTCNCRMIARDCCFFTDGFGGPCECKCHRPTPPEEK